MKKNSRLRKAPQRTVRRIDVSTKITNISFERYNFSKTKIGPRQSGDIASYVLFFYVL